MHVIRAATNLFSLSINLANIFTINRLIVCFIKDQRSAKNARLIFSKCDVFNLLLLSKQQQNTETPAANSHISEAKPAILLTFPSEKWLKRSIIKIVGD